MNWTLFVSVFLLVFVAELPDKTAFATILLAARSSRPWSVFVGVGIAFVVQSAVAVAFGGILTLLPERWVNIAAGVLFLVFAAVTWRSRNEQAIDDNEKPEPAQSGGIAFCRAAFAAFWVIFIAEWGDVTQLATASLQAKYDDALTIFCSATLALLMVTAIAVVVGRTLGARIHTRLLKQIAATAFATAGMYFLILK